MNNYTSNVIQLFLMNNCDIKHKRGGPQATCHGGQRFLL